MDTSSFEKPQARINPNPPQSHHSSSSLPSSSATNQTHKYPLTPKARPIPAYILENRPPRWSEVPAIPPDLPPRPILGPRWRYLPWVASVICGSYIIFTVFLDDPSAVAGGSGGLGIGDLLSGAIKSRNSPDLNESVFSPTRRWFRKRRDQLVLGIPFEPETESIWQTMRQSREKARRQFQHVMKHGHTPTDSDQFTEDDIGTRKDPLTRLGF